jgi:hypothetical protein
MKEFVESRSVFLFLRRVNEWFRLKKLEHDLRCSRGFQKRCEKLNCPTLAALEQGHQETLLRKIDGVKHQSLSSLHRKTLAQNHADKVRWSIWPPFLFKISATNPTQKVK